MSIKFRGNALCVKDGKKVMLLLDILKIDKMNDSVKNLE